MQKMWAQKCSRNDRFTRLRARMCTACSIHGFRVQMFVNQGNFSSLSSEVFLKFCKFFAINLNVFSVRERCLLQSMSTFPELHTFSIDLRNICNGISKIFAITSHQFATFWRPFSFMFTNPIQRSCILSSTKSNNLQAGRNALPLVYACLLYTTTTPNKASDIN